MTDKTNMELRERYHMDAIAKIREQAHKDAAPHIKALVEIEGRKPPKPIFFTKQQFIDAGIQLPDGGK